MSSYQLVYALVSNV